MLTGSPDLSFLPTRPHSASARFFSPPLTESLEQATSLVTIYLSTDHRKHFLRPNTEGLQIFILTFLPVKPTDPDVFTFNRHIFLHLRATGII